MAPARRTIFGIAIILLVVATYATADNGSWYADNCYYIPAPYQPARVGCRVVTKDKAGQPWLVYLDPVGTFGLRVLTDLDAYLRLDPTEIRTRVYKSISKGSSTLAFLVRRGGPPPSRCPMANLACLDPATCQVDQACIHRKFGDPFQH